MKITRVENNIPFKKSLEAKCHVLQVKNGKKEQVPCSIFSLSDKEDRLYFEKIPNLYDWDDARYFDVLGYDMKDGKLAGIRKMYTIETQEGHCISVSEVVDVNPYYEIELLEVSPKNLERRNHKSPYFKYVGETMLAFLAKVADKEQQEQIEVYPASSAYDFYTDKCFFVDYDTGGSVFLVSKDFKELIKQNERHTNSTIDFNV